MTGKTTNQREQIVMIVKEKACEAGQFESFAELTALVMARQYVKKGRKQDARRILLSFLKKHPATLKVTETLKQIA